jgi:hypothetical protein
LNTRTPEQIRTPPASPPDLRHLNQEQLARRWSLSPRTLERWRWLRQGPQYLRIGGHVVYRIEDVEAYEATNLRQTSGAGAGK